MSFVVLCIGNRNGGDDAIGPYISDHLSEDKTLKVIDAGIVPENYTGVIKKSKTKNLLIIDAVDMGLSPGSIRIVPKEKIGLMHISTHGIPLSILVKYLEKDLEEIIIIGIQPKKMKGAISEEVKISADLLVEIIKKEEIKKLDVLN